MPHLFAPETFVLRSERGTRLRKLERPDDPAPVIWMDARRRLRIPLGERVVCGDGAELIVPALPALTRPRLRSRRKIELDERGSKVEPGAADHDRGQAVIERRIDDAMGKLGVLAD